MTQFQNPFDRSDAALSYLPMAKISATRGELLCSAARDSTGARPTQVAPIGSHLILDFGVVFVGGAVIAKGAKPQKLLVIDDGRPMPQIPNDGQKWQVIMELQVLIEGFGLFLFSLTSKINQGRIAAARHLSGLCAEAQRGMLQVYILKGFDEVSTDYGDFFGIILEPTGTWVERDVSIFGPRLVPEPSPILAGPASQPRLPDNDNGGAPAPPPANDPANIPVATPPPAPVPTSPVPPPVTPVATPPAANDPFARYRPSGAGKRPY
jgi:hypothetical protein